MRGLFRVLGTLLVIIVIVVAALLAWLWIAEYRPANEETVTATAGLNHDFARTGEIYHIVTMNIGYGGLDRTQDFFMDGGKGVKPGSQAEVEENLAGMLGALHNEKADLVLLQEVDVSASRSYAIDETELFTRGLSMG
ncbi:MAG TPA: endonuclease, partial [Candidatus Limiplasma sp.]|nr:endonuclease [Candidatus Limiplasma sp.]